MNVLLVAGGSSGEREVSIRSGNAVREAIELLGHRCRMSDPKSTGYDITHELDGIDVVFLALHGRGGEDGTLQQQLEKIKMPFTGSGSTASALCFDKWQYKKFLQKHDFPVVGGNLVSLHRLDERLFEEPYVLKPCDEGSSLDTHIVRTPDSHALDVSRQLLETHHEMILEPLINGTEITVGIFGSEALPIIEIIPPEGREFDYANKYNGQTQELCPPLHVSPEIQEQAQSLALDIHTATGCQDMSRTDIMIDGSGKPYVLETNTIPGLTTQSLLPKMVREAGYTMEQFVDELLKMALKK